MDNKGVGVPFVVTYHPHLKNLSKINKKHIRHLYADLEARSAFTQEICFASFLSVRNLRSHLARSKFYPQKRKIGSSKCNSPSCVTCNNNKECDTFTSYVTKETSCLHHFNSNSKCLTNLFSCKVPVNQYFGSTTDKSRYRGTTIRTPNVKQKEEKIRCKNIYHFLHEDHDDFFNNVEISLIDKTDLLEPQRREEFWRSKLRTVAPLGLNIEE